MRSGGGCGFGGCAIRSSKSHLSPNTAIVTDDSSGDVDSASSVIGGEGGGLDSRTVFQVVKERTTIQHGRSTSKRTGAKASRTGAKEWKGVIVME